MNIFKKLLGHYEIEHMKVTFQSQDDLALYNKKKVFGNLDVSGSGNYRARKLTKVGGNLLVADKASLLAKKLQIVTHNVYAVNTDTLDLPQLKQAHCVYISNVQYIHLPNLENSQLVISRDFPVACLDVPASNTIRYDATISLEALRKVLEDQITQRIKNSRRSR